MAKELNHALANITDEHKAGRLTLDRALKGRQISYYYNIGRGTSRGGAVIRPAEPQLLGQLTAWVWDMANSFNLGKNINEEQAYGIAKTIIRDFWHLKLAELPIFFTRAKTGYFGKVYDRLDEAIIYDWLIQFSGERQDEIERQTNWTGKYSTDMADTGAAQLMEGLRKMFPEEYAEKSERKNLGFNDPEYRRFYLEYAKKESEGGKYREVAEEATEKLKTEGKF